MVFRSSLFSALALAGALALSPAAEAKVTIHIGIGIGTWSGPGFYDGTWRDKLSCREGRWVLRNSGFRHVQALECEGRYYLYKAQRHGRPVIVQLDARSGRIVDVERDGLAKPM